MPLSQYWDSKICFVDKELGKFKGAGSVLEYEDQYYQKGTACCCPSADSFGD